MAKVSGLVPPFDRYRSLVEEALPGTRLGGTELPAVMTSYQLGWVDETGVRAHAPLGKLIRPVLSLWACEAAGEPASVALPVALAVEWIHNFTLVHDDVQDGDRLRRHRPTVWAVWGREQAINAGDALFARAFEIITSRDGVHPERTLRAAEILARATRRVIAGQCLDLELVGKPETSPGAYLRMARLKTGVLLGASLAAGAAVAGADRLTPVFARAGQLLGLAFQLRDDWLGLFGDTHETGKPKGDLDRRKVTYPIVAAYKAASEGRRRRLSELYARTDPAATDELRTLLDELGGPELGAGLAEAIGHRAVRAVDSIGEPSLTADFAALVEHLAARTS